MEYADLFQQHIGIKQMLTEHKKKIVTRIKLITMAGGLLPCLAVYAAPVVIENENISVQDTWGVFNNAGTGPGQYIIKNTTINVAVTGSGSQSHGVLVNAPTDELPNTTTTLVQDSNINSEGQGAFLVGGYTKFDNTKIMASGEYGIVTMGGNISVNNGSVIESKKGAKGIYLTKGYDGTYLENNVTIDHSSVIADSNTAIEIGNDAIAHIDANNNSTISSGSNSLLVANDGSVVDFNLNRSNAYGSLSALNNANLDVTLSNSSSLTGSSQHVNNINIDSTSSWVVVKNSDVNSVNNSGVIRLSDGDNIGSTLTIHDNYSGNNGTLIFNSKLAGDESVTDKVVIEGNSSGNTNVIVNNIGGHGAQTIEGIEIIHIDGQSDATFTQSGRIVAGAYDYTLVHGNNNNNSSWFLTSQQSVEPPVEPPETNNNVIRPEGGAYAANLAAASTLFENRLSDRQGVFYTNPTTGEREYTSLWLHQIGGHTKANDKSGQLNTTSNHYTAMIGGDIGTGSGDYGSWRLGILAGYGNSHSNTNSGITGYRAKGVVKGYTTGLYGTWYASGSDQIGLYVDTVFQYSWFNNTVKGDEVSNEDYNSKGASASVESGYIIPLSESLRTSFYIQPQIQVTWSGISADDHTENNGTRVKDNTNNNIRSSLGIKAFAKTHSSIDDNSGRFFKPFVEANWIHNTQNYGVSMDDVSVAQAGTRNIAETKLGIEGNFDSQLRLTGNIGIQVGDNGWSDASAGLGLRYSF